MLDFKQTGDQKFPQSHTTQINGNWRKSQRKLTVTRHPEDNYSKASSSLFPIKMVAKLDRHKVHNNKTRTKH